MQPMSAVNNPNPNVARSRQFTAQSVLHCYCHFRQLRAGQGTARSANCYLRCSYAYGETALQTVFANAPAQLRLHIACRSVNSMTPCCTLGSKLFTRKHNLHFAPHSHSCRHISHISPTRRGIADIAASTSESTRLTSSTSA